MEDLEVALEKLSYAEPQRFLSPSPELAQLSRDTSTRLFSILRPLSPKALMLEHLLADVGFDFEQIWLQIDPLSKSFVSHLRRRILNLIETEKISIQLSNTYGEIEPLNQAVKKVEGLTRAAGSNDEKGETDDDVGGEDDEETENEDEDDNKNEGRGTAVGIEDQFLKIKELEKYMEGDEAREYGVSVQRKSQKMASENFDEAEDDDNETEQELEEDKDDESDGFDFADADGYDVDDHGESAENAKYDDFFGTNKRKGPKDARDRKHRSTKDDILVDSGMEDLMLGYDHSDHENDDDDSDSKVIPSLSTHEKEREKIKSRIEQMEKANLDPKVWTMQGEVTAAKRPKNSALEVDLDFERNVRPPPIITADVNISLEDIIKRRILEARFDDLQRLPALTSTTTKEHKELDEKKSKKGLAELYEEDYAQKAGLAIAPLTTTNEQKEEANILFKKLCLKLDALSHFHFAPKPVIEDMSISSNVPALAMEEIAPLAVSDAAMLAPEEIFQGKGSIKEEAELTQAERKRRRANKKRRFRAEALIRDAKKLRKSVMPSGTEGKNEA